MKSITLVNLGDMRNTRRPEMSHHLLSLSQGFEQVLSYLKGMHVKPGFLRVVFKWETLT